MKNMFKAVAVGVIALMLGGGSVSAATTSNSSNKQKVAKIKAENKKKIKNAKKKQIKKNKQAKAVKANSMSKLQAQKRAEQKKIAALKVAIPHKQKNMHVAVPNSSATKKPTHKNTIARTENLPSKLINPNIPGKKSPKNDIYYAYNGKHDTTARIKGNLTAKQQKEIADYIVTLINSHQKELGYAPVKWSAQMQSNMNKLSNARRKANVGAFGTPRDIVNDVVNPSTTGLFQTNFELYERFDRTAQLNGTKYPTMLQLKVVTLNTLTAMFYDDSTQYFNHKSLPQFLGGLQIGAVIEQTSRDDANKYPYGVVIGFASEQGKKVNFKNQNPTFAATYRKNVSPANDIASLKASQKKLAKLNKQIKVRNAALNKVMKKKFNQNAKEFNKAKQQANRVMANKLRQL